MSAPIPSSKPQAGKTKVLAAAKAAWDKHRPGKILPELFVVAVRAYYRDTMGKSGANDVGMYDDAFFIVCPNGMSAWNGNTDPSRYGWNPNADGYMARLRCGVWNFIRLKHHWSRPDGYMAFGQGDNDVTVDRIKADGSVNNSITGTFGINLHRGGINGTSSEGCLTVPKEQWDAFNAMLTKAIKAQGGGIFPLILIDGPIN